MTENDFLQQLKDNPESAEFADLMQVIEDNYSYEPTAFDNGELHNEAGQNEGSCKLFAFAKIHGLDEKQTLNCFGIYYRDDVLNDPNGNDHGNIRQFMKTGWSGIKLSDQVLTKL